MQITTIDTRVGTQSKYRFSNGNTLPLTGTPFAMNYFTVQNNGTEGSWFFDPQSRRFEGFRLTHQQVLGWAISNISRFSPLIA